MAQVVYGLIADNGDGSSSMRWFRNMDMVNNLLDDDDMYYANEGSPAETLTFPDDICLEVCGFSFDDGQDFT